MIIPRRLIGVRERTVSGTSRSSQPVRGTAAPYGTPTVGTLLGTSVVTRDLDGVGIRA
jgi:hypothetical protein